MSSNNSPVKEYVEKAKSIPPAVYHLVLINVIMVIGFVIQELTVMYMVGTLMMVTLLVAAVGRVSQMWDTPDQLISSNVRDRLEEIRNDFHNFVKLLDVK